MVLMVLSHTHLMVCYLPTYLILKFTSSLCNSSEEQPLVIISGMMKSSSSASLAMRKSSKMISELCRHFYPL